MADRITYVGLDVHKESIVVAVADGGLREEVREYGRIANTPAALDRLLRKLGGDGMALRFCYEAGPCGYGIQRRLSARGHECVVVAPSLIPKRAGDRVKTDRRDAANRTVAVLSKMFTLAIRWGMRTDNPTKGVERNPEQSRHRYMTGDELRRLTAALAAHPSRQAADAIRLLLLTGARTQEVLKASWDQFDLETGIWIKPSSHTKQKREHRVPLSAPVRQLLVDMQVRQQKKGPPARYLFPGRAGDGPMVDLKSSWRAICRAADLHGLRVHDLRHSFASILVSSGLSLPVIGALLGHSTTNTTARYAHLFDDPLRAAAERVGAVVTTAGNADKPAAEIVRLGRR
jgi:integrase